MFNSSESFRKNTAKDIMVAIVQSDSYFASTSTREQIARRSILLEDELIKQLNKRKEE